MMTLVIVLFFALVGGPQQSTAANDALLDAAQRNDLPGVIKALEQGANINAKARYERTALLYGARNANLAMVRLLVERGADATVEDSYYHRNAIGTAVTDRNIEMVRYLIEKGTPVSADLVASAIDRKDAGLLKTLLEHAKLPDALLAAMHALSVKSGNAEASAVLQAAMDARPAAATSIVTILPSALQAYAGTYRQDSNTFFSTSTTQTLVVALKDGMLTASLGGRPMILFATSDLSFVAPESPAFDFKFERRGIVVERVVVNRPLRPREDPTAPYLRVSSVSDSLSMPAPSNEDLAVAPREASRPWPAFRGSAAAGVADGQGAVADWDIGTGRNIVWKTPIPGIANASPIVWNNRVFIATAVSGAGDATFRTGDHGDTTPVKDLSEHSFRLFALDGQTGSVLWEREVYKGVPRTTRHTKGSQASSTPATDGRSIAVLFGSAGLLAVYDMNGGLLWKKDLGLLDAGFFYDPAVQWGHSSSPIIYQDSVVVQVDRQKESFVAAYSLKDGAERWRTTRDGEIPTWGTPAIVTGKSGDELITNGTKIRGYDPKTGKLRWTLAPNSEITVATPVAGPDVVYVTGGYPPARPLYAIRPGFSGDISLAKGANANDAIAWSNDRDGIYIPTPLFYRGLLYTVNNNGVVTVFEAGTGERVYRARLGVGGSFSASPVAADGRVYFANEDGEIFVTRAGREFIQISKNEMNEVIMATPAISNGLIIVRTLHHVYGIGQVVK